MDLMLDWLKPSAAISKNAGALFLSLSWQALVFKNSGGESLKGILWGPHAIMALNFSFSLSIWEPD